MRLAIYLWREGRGSGFGQGGRARMRGLVGFSRGKEKMVRGGGAADRNMREEGVRSEGGAGLWPEGGTAGAEVQGSAHWAHRAAGGWSSKSAGRDAG